MLLMLANARPPAGWPTLEQAAMVLTLRAGHNSAMVVLAAMLLGVAAGTVGVFAVQRRRALMSDAVAHAALPGIAMAFLVATWLGGQGRSLPVLLSGAAVSGIVGILLVQAIVRWTRLREDAAIGIVLSVLFGIGITLLSYIQQLPVGTQGGLHHFIYGQTAAMGVGDAVLIGACALGSVAVAAMLFKEFRLVCFDDRFAASIGLPVTLLDLAMMTLVVIVTVIGLQAVGLILVVAMLIIPAAAARFWTERFAVMTMLAGIIGGLSGYLGASLSALLPRMPAGAVIVLTAGALFSVSLLGAPSRGLLAGGARRLALRHRVAREHLLRALYEALSARGETPRAHVPVAVAELPTGSAPLLRRLGMRSLVRRLDDGMALTERGLADAERLERNHRLWEQFMMRHAELAATHVDRSADLVEHVLSPELVAQLEAELLAAQPQDPPDDSGGPA